MHRPAVTADCMRATRTAYDGGCPTDSPGGAVIRSVMEPTAAAASRSVDAAAAAATTRAISIPPALPPPPPEPSSAAAAVVASGCLHPHDALTPRV